MRTNFPARQKPSDISPLEAEVIAEQAAALAQSGRRVEAALAALAEAGEADRPHRLKAAADAVYGFFIQREIVGLRDHRGVIAHHAIPPAVLARLGAA
ncbi:MAG TPA: DUF6665 family protein [Sphingomonas sp.]|jgi:hypothetical protein